MLIKIGRWKVKFGSLLIVGILGFISTCLIFQVLLLSDFYSMIMSYRIHYSDI